MSASLFFLFQSLVFCPISRPMELLKSNYEYWKSEAPDSPLNSGSDEEVNMIRLTLFFYYVHTHPPTHSLPIDAPVSTKDDHITTIIPYVTFDISSTSYVNRFIDLSTYYCYHDICPHFHVLYTLCTYILKL